MKTVVNSGISGVHQKVVIFVVFIKKCHFGVFGEFLHSQARLFTESVSFDSFKRVPFWCLKSGGFGINGMLGVRLYPEEAWWAGYGPLRACWHPVQQTYGRWWYPGVWGTGRPVDPWYPPVVRVRGHCLPLFPLFLRHFPVFREFPENVRISENFPKMSEFQRISEVCQRISEVCQRISEVCQSLSEFVRVRLVEAQWG